MFKTRTWVHLTPVALLLAACGPSQEVQRELAEMTAISAEKDSLLMQVTDNARVMSEISAELARVKAAPAAAAGSAEAPMQVNREIILADIRDLTARIQDSEDRLLKSQERIDALTRTNNRLSGQVANIQKAVADFQATIENQKQTIVTLTDEVSSLREQNTRLASDNTTLTEEKLALGDTVAALSERDNTVYYVIGTKDELLERGVIEEEGGSRVFFVFGRRGTTIVPARDLDPAQFTAIDRRQVFEIPMPWADRDYRIASRQDLTSLETPPDADGDFRGVLRITDPDRFWSGGRYLIVVQR